MKNSGECISRIRRIDARETKLIDFFLRDVHRSYVKRVHDSSTRDDESAKEDDVETLRKKNEERKSIEEATNASALVTNFSLSLSLSSSEFFSYYKFINCVSTPNRIAPRKISLSGRFLLTPLPSPLPTLPSTHVLNIPNPPVSTV